MRGVKYLLYLCIHADFRHDTSSEMASIIAEYHTGCTKHCNPLHKALRCSESIFTLACMQHYEPRQTILSPVKVTSKKSQVIISFGFSGMICCPHMRGFDALASAFIQKKQRLTKSLANCARLSSSTTKNSVTASAVCCCERCPDTPPACAQAIIRRISSLSWGVSDGNHTLPCLCIRGKPSWLSSSNTKCQISLRLFYLENGAPPCSI